MKTAIALGTFDGVHLGHKRVLSSAAENENSLALVFDLPPKAYFLKESICVTDAAWKKKLILDCGINKVEFLDFNKVKDIKAESFFETILEKYSPDNIYCGENYTFGKGGKGDITLLKRLCEGNNITLNVCSFVCDGEKIISSSLIRELLKAGKISEANRLMTNDFSFCSTVVSGDRRGRTIGFPTINQLYPKELIQLKYGVYSSYVFINSKKYKSITNVGIRPTYKTEEVYAETHILDFNAELYGERIRVYLKDFLRDEKKFASLDELKETIREDCSKIL